MAKIGDFYYRLGISGLIQQSITLKKKRIVGRPLEVFISLTADQTKTSHKLYVSSHVLKSYAYLYRVNWKSSTFNRIRLPCIESLVGLEAVRLSRTSTDLVMVSRDQVVAVVRDVGGILALLTSKKLDYSYPLWGLMLTGNKKLAVYGDCCFELLTYRLVDK